MQNRS